MGLLHPLLADHPFVKHVETTLDIQLDRNGAGDEYGHSQARLGMWWHAVDLITTGHWRDLLGTSQFTTGECIAGAVAYGLTYSPHEAKGRDGHISTAEAREIMATLDVQPAGSDSFLRESFLPPWLVKSEKGVESWPVNEIARDQYSNAWGHIFGIEAGWFAYDLAGFLGWTKVGRDRFWSIPVTADPRTEPRAVPKSEKEADGLAETLDLKPSDRGGRQLELF
jgi:hypothetical protein